MATAQQPVNIEGLGPEAAAAVVKLSRKMANSENMDERISFYQMARKADPSISIPSDVQLEQFRREQKAEKETETAQRKAEETTRRLETQRQALIDSGRYDEETVKKIEAEVMTPRGLSDYEAGAIIYASQNPEPQVNVPQRGQAGEGWTLPWQGQAKEKVTELISNPRKAALAKGYAVVAEFRKQKRA
jgi:hypothetical protein